MTSVTSKRGRPVKAEAERRSKQAAAWLTPAEYDHALASAGGAGIADFAREIVLKAWKPVALQRGGRRGKIAGARRLAFRLTFAEKEYLKALAADAGLTEADYVRLSVLSHTGYEAERNVLRLEISRPGLGKRLAQLAAARNQTIAEYVLSQAEEEPKATGKAVPDAALLLKLDQVKHSLDRIGNNINQIAKAAHVGRQLPGLSDAAVRELGGERKRAAEILEEVASRYAW